MRRIVAFGLAVLVGLGLGVVPTHPAYAGDNGAWSVEPTPPEQATSTPRDYFVFEGNPGSVIQDKVRITNFTKAPITFKLYGADAYNTAVDGFFALKSLDEPQVDVGAWASLPVTEVTVAAQTQTDAPITITIPKNATPGDHVGGIVALNAAIESTQQNGDIEIGVQRAVGARIYLRVSGPTRAGLAVSDVSFSHDRGVLPWSGAGKGAVTYTVENTGNLRQTPDLALALTGLFGRGVDTASPEGKVDLLPGQKVTLTQQVEGIGHLNHLTAKVTVTTSEGAAHSADTSAWLIPWLFLIVVLLLIVGLIAWWRRRRLLLQRGLEDAQLAPQLIVPSNP